MLFKQDTSILGGLHTVNHRLASAMSKDFTATLLVVCIGLTSCVAGDPTLGLAGPRWAQQPEEQGRLPIGRVVSVTRIDAQPETSLYQPGASGGQGHVGVQLNTSGFIRSTARKDTGLYRHSVHLNSGDVRDVDVEYTFNTGDCVALRSLATKKGKLVELVPARPAECG